MRKLAQKGREKNGVDTVLWTWSKLPWKIIVHGEKMGAGAIRTVKAKTGKKNIRGANHDSIPMKKKPAWVRDYGGNPQWIKKDVYQIRRGSW